MFGVHLALCSFHLRFILLAVHLVHLSFVSVH